jgi:Tfp pilus assembly protein PilV
MKKVLSNTKRVRGFLLVEMVLAGSLFILFLTAFTGVFYYGLQSSSSAGDRSRAVMFAEEGQEAVRSMKNTNFSSLADGTYGLMYSNNMWNLVPTGDVLGVYTRQVTVTTLDPNRKNVTVTISWQQTPTRLGSISTQAVLTNWKTIPNLGVGVTVVSEVVNHGMNKTTADFGPYKVGSAVVTLASSTLFTAGTYAISGATNPYYTQTFSGDCDSNGQITVATGTAKLCVLTYEEKLAYITITNTIINHGGTKTTNDFAPYKAGSTTVTLGAPTPVNSGTHTVSEATSSNYALSYGGSCASNGSVTIASGESKTCSLTNEETIFAGAGKGVLLYGDKTTTPKYRVFDDTTGLFGSQLSTFAAPSVGNSWLVKTSPTQHIALAGFTDSLGTFTIMCFDGTNWTQEWQEISTVVDDDDDEKHRFDIAFEKTSGDAMVVYSRSTHDLGHMGYRTKSGTAGCGTGWGLTQDISSQHTGDDESYLKLAQDRRAGSNLLALVWTDEHEAISAKIWDGSAWGNEPPTPTDNNTERITTLQEHDVENMDAEYESLSGDLMIAYANENGANGLNGVRYRTCTGGTATCTWTPVTTPPTFLDDATSLDLSPNPNTDEMVFASVGHAGGDLQIGYWSGTGWINTANVDTSSAIPDSETKVVSTGWLTKGATTYSVVVYADLNSPNVNWYTGLGGVFTRRPDFVATPAIATPRGYMDVQSNPFDQTQLMFLTSDNAKKFYAKRLTLTGTSTLTWSNADQGASLVTSLSKITSSPFSFAFWQH